MVFNDGAGTWDSNGGLDWHLSVTDCGGGTPAEVTVNPAAPQGCVPVTITYRANEGPLTNAANVYLYIGHDGWLDVANPGTAMTESPEGTWTAAYAIPAGARRLNFAFRDGLGTWDNHYGQNWSVPVAHCWPAPPGIGPDQSGRHDFRPPCHELLHSFGDGHGGYSRLPGLEQQPDRPGRQAARRQAGGAWPGSRWRSARM